MLELYICIDNMLALAVLRRHSTAEAHKVDSVYYNDHDPYQLY